VRVETGEPVGRGRIPVLAGIEAGMRVVVDGAILLQNSGGGL
jgi:multidrug efflux pump subunit AcrA (membrane-fusion protein)